MLRAICCVCLAAGLLPAAPTFAAESKLEGTYELSYLYNASSTQIHLAIIRFETKNGKLAGTLVDAIQFIGDHPTLSDVALDGQLVHFKVHASGGADAVQAFEGKPGKDLVLGSLTEDTSAFPAQLSRTTAHKIEANKAITPLNEPTLIKAMDLVRKPRILRHQAQQEKDAEKKAKLKKEAEQAEEMALKGTPGFYREIVEKHAEGPAVFVAGYALLSHARVNNTPEEARRLAEILTTAAEAYGPKMEAEVQTHLAELLAKKDNLSDLALHYAKNAQKSLSDKSPSEVQVRVLKALAKALGKGNHADELKDVDARLAKLDAILDKEYLAKMPPFKPAGFSGRKGKSNRVVVMELFTGAQCPPCVAADAAFDGLEKVFKPNEVILLQYHLHIPGPDPLTNADTVARAKHYNVDSTPSTFFNGKPQPPSGGPLSASEGKYREYRGIIDPLLEEAAPVRLSTTANRKGNHIEIKAEVADLPEPGEAKRLRFFLVEEAIRYVGSNRMRFHHHVVRAMPGGVEGLVLKEKNSQQSISVHLDELRQTLIKYLDSYGKENPFPYADRPLDFKDLKLVALVQNDATGEILQATQVDLGNE